MGGAGAFADGARGGAGWAAAAPPTPRCGGWLRGRGASAPFGLVAFDREGDEEAGGDFAGGRSGGAEAGGSSVNCREMEASNSSMEAGASDIADRLRGPSSS